jgi:hypothetical protein
VSTPVDDGLEGLPGDSPTEVRAALHAIRDALSDEAAAALRRFLRAWIAGPRRD